MWYSSGGTSSVVHTDSVENMNCLVAGIKKFVFVSPEHAVSSTECDVTTNLYYDLFNFAAIFKSVYYLPYNF